MKKIVLTFGLVAGGILSLMMLVNATFMDQIGFDRGAIIGYTTMVLAFLMVFFGIRSYRDAIAGGVISFGRAFAIGIQITLIATVCYVATWEIVYYKLVPDFGDKYGAHVIDKLEASGATQATVDSARVQIADFVTSYKNPLVNIAYTFIEPFPIGLVFALVSAGMLRRKRSA